MTTPTMTWTRLTRRLGSDHNPLRRPADLMAAWLLPAVIAMFLALGPLVVVGAAVAAHVADSAQQRAQRDLHQVPAVLLAATPGPLAASGGATSWTTRAPARWTAGGRQQAGWIPARAGTRAGSTVALWLDPSGQVAGPPLSAAQARDHVTGAAAGGLLVLAGVLGGLALITRWRLNRRRLADWDAAWRAISPQWRYLD